MQPNVSINHDGNMSVLYSNSRMCTFSMEENKRLSKWSGYCQRCACMVCMTSAISWPNCVFSVVRIVQASTAAFTSYRERHIYIQINKNFKNHPQVMETFWSCLLSFCELGERLQRATVTQWATAKLQRSLTFTKWSIIKKQPYTLDAHYE